MPAAIALARQPTHGNAAQPARALQSSLGTGKRERVESADSNKIMPGDFLRAIWSAVAPQILA